MNKVFNLESCSYENVKYFRKLFFKRQVKTQHWLQNWLLN